MRSLLFPFALLPGLLLPAAGYAHKAAIDEVVRSTMKQWSIPGLALVVVRQDKVVYREGFGVRTCAGRAREELQIRARVWLHRARDVA